MQKSLSVFFCLGAFFEIFRVYYLSRVMVMVYRMCRRIAKYLLLLLQMSKKQILRFDLSGLFNAPKGIVVMAKKYIFVTGLR